jgi:hypothetical protein
MRSRAKPLPEADLQIRILLHTFGLDLMPSDGVLFGLHTSKVLMSERKASFQRNVHCSYFMNGGLVRLIGFIWMEMVLYEWIFTFVLENQLFSVPCF